MKQSGNETAEHVRRALEAAAECKRHLSAKECAKRSQVAKAARRLRDACGIEGASFSDLDLVLDFVEPLVKENPACIQAAAVTREQKIKELLEPITWPWSTSVRWRQELVMRRHKEVRDAIPLMSDDERKRAAEWQKKESHEGLWD